MPPVFYPSMVVDFNLRFDEVFHISEVPDPILVTDLTTGKKRFDSPSIGPQLAPQPLMLDAKADQDDLNSLPRRIPKSASVELTGYRQASRFSLTFDFRDLPIDPRLLRAVKVSIYLGAISPADFAQGMVKAEVDGFRKSVLRPNIDTNLLLVGLVDSWHVQHNERGSEVSMEGRDITGILLDSPLDPGLVKNLDLSKPINQVIENIVHVHPRLGKKQIVEINASDWVDENGKQLIKLPSPADGLIRMRLGAQGKKGKVSPQGLSSGLNYWELISDYCAVVGAIPVFVGTKLLIRPAKSLYDQKHGGLTPKIATPFKDGKTRSVTIGEGSQQYEKDISVRQFVYGRDVSSLSFERKYTGAKPKIVECTSLDPSKKGKDKFISAIYPTKNERITLDARRLGVTENQVKKAYVTSVSPSGSETETEKIRVPVPGIANIKILKEIAKNIYEEIGRGEMGGAVETKNLASFGGDNTDPDVLRLRPGDAVELLVDSRALSSKSPLVAPLSDFARMSVNEATKELQSRMGKEGISLSPDIARVIVATAKGSILELQTFFRVSNVKYSWSTSGLGMAFDFHNYVEGRAQLQATQTKPTGATNLTQRSTT